MPSVQIAFLDVESLGTLQDPFQCVFLDIGTAD